MKRATRLICLVVIAMLLTLVIAVAAQTIGVRKCEGTQQSTQTQVAYQKMIQSHALTQQMAQNQHAYQKKNQTKASNRKMNQGANGSGNGGQGSNSGGNRNGNG